MLILEILDTKDWKQSKHIGISGYTTSRNTFGVFEVYLKKGSASGVLCNSQEHFLRSSLCCLLQSNSITSECVRVKILSASDQRAVCILAATIAATKHWSVHTQTFCFGFALSYWNYDYYLSYYGQQDKV